MALGAQQQNVLRMILRQGMLQLLSAWSGGLILALLAPRRLLANFLVGVQPQDPATFALVVACCLAAVAFLACWIPGARATPDRSAGGDPVRLGRERHRPELLAHLRARRDEMGGSSGDLALLESPSLDAGSQEPRLRPPRRGA